MAPPALDFEPVPSVGSEAGHIFDSEPQVERHRIAEPVKSFSLVNTDEVVEDAEEESYAVQAPANVPSSKSSPDSWLPLNHVMASVNKPTSGATKLRKMIFETNELIVCPGVYDGLSARTAIEVGFNALYMVSCSTCDP